MKGWLWALAVPLLLFFACSPADTSGVAYKDPEELYYFELPDEWNLYEEGTAPLTSRPFNPTAPELEGVYFDRFPEADPGNFAMVVAEAEYPVGMATVRPVGEEERDFLSRAHLAQTIFPYREQPQYQELLKEDFEFEEDVEGIVRAVQYRDAQTNDLAVVMMQSVTDAQDTRVYAIAVGCSAICFQQYQDEIVSIVSSWKVNTRK